MQIRVEQWSLNEGGIRTHPSVAYVDGYYSLIITSLMQSCLGYGYFFFSFELELKDYLLTGLECVWSAELLASTGGEVDDHSDSRAGEGRS
jgi:hypothetical protein